MSRLVISAIASFAIGCGPNAMDAMCTSTVSASGDPATNHTNIQNALSNAKAGDVVCLHAGSYSLKDELDLSVDNVEIRSMTDGMAVLDFQGQQHGANGLSITGNGDKVSNITVKNSPGDAIRATQAMGISFVGVTVTWDDGAQTSNGAYGLYPVQSTNVLIDNCKVSYASDAGIYVGQSHDIVVKNSEAFGNVAGIEIENSTDAEVFDNDSHDNTGGILVFNLPNLMMQGGARSNVHDNKVHKNNGMNFAAMSSIVHIVPSGTGFLLMAAADNEIHNNTIQDNESTGIAVVSYFVAQQMFNDPNYNPYPEGNYVHDNQFSGNGQYPSGLANAIALAIGKTTVTDMVWDGIVDTSKMNTDGKLTNCFHANLDGSAAASYTNLGLDAMGKFHASTDLGMNDCMHPALPAVSF